jgi:predicted transcriptional regulator
MNKTNEKYCAYCGIALDETEREKQSMEGRFYFISHWLAKKYKIKLTPNEFNECCKDFDKALEKQRRLNYEKSQDVDGLERNY